jgi:hypothetical protein
MTTTGGTVELQVQEAYTVQTLMLQVYQLFQYIFASVTPIIVNAFQVSTTTEGSVVKWVVVTIPQLNPTLANPKNGASVKAGSTVKLTVTVTGNGEAVSGATVTITVDGSKVCTTTTNSQGSASCSFKASKDMSTYTWSATATKSGFAPGTSPPFTFHT